LVFYAAASASNSLQVFFNGGYYVTETIGTSWQKYTVSLASIGDPSTEAPYTTLNQLVFEGTSYTLYLYDVAFE
jgi:hypothetical protein